MQTRRGLNRFLMGMIIGVVFLRMPTVLGGESSEFESLILFLRAVDPQNMLSFLGQDASSKNPCLDKWKGVKCNIVSTSILEISLENLNLNGVLDANSLCKLPNIRVLSLAENRIQGNIPNAIMYCRKLTYLNLSSNLLSGRIPRDLAKMKYLRKLDISNNHFEGMIPIFQVESKKPNSRIMYLEEFKDHTNVSPESSQSDNSEEKSWLKRSQNWIPLVIGLSLFIFVTYLAGKKASELARDKAILKSLHYSPTMTPQVRTTEEVKPERILSDLVFFVDEEERFEMEEFLEATADLRSQSLLSSLYKVILKNNAVYSVTRLKRLQVSFEEFCKIMNLIGDVKHPNILPLVAYSFTLEDKLLIYKYQNKGSLLNLFEDYIESKRDFPLRLRLSIAGGIARGLSFMYRITNEHETILHHGNLKLSNILLDDNDEAVISEFGHSRFLDPKGDGICSSKGYTAPEKGVSEKGDVYSFGVILLELLTGKPVERTGVDLPKLVNAMIREEWTGEVFDREIAKAEAAHWAFILLNIALKCVSELPENRPTMEEVLEKIEDVMNEEQDPTMSPLSSSRECHQDTCLLHSIIAETWETPGSNY
ncbi:hypothetical protein G4B88_015502 [Cannabis sativa]|uniref:Protein kinase domain-containing protein n=1 Tax=Cannabis sativa TaxID=3483 RepID=A0A7J6GE44_CANSA|nr:hypothetical protein G4B88_015502 [Cannabis sativa]